MAFRTFLALDLDGSILDALAEITQRLDVPGAEVRWVARDNLHVTLHFLGDVADEAISDVCNAAAGAAGRTPAFSFDVRGIACIPPRGRIRMVWANVLDRDGLMGELHELLGAELTGLGMPVEARRFKPHITLGRIKSARDSEALREAAATYHDKDFGRQHAGELVAYASQLTPRGPVYTPLCRARLGERAARHGA